jgi:hypothetical protein
VRFWAAEEPQRIGDDASLLISWDDLGRRLVRWEDFVRRHPALPEVQDEVIPHVKNLIALYLFGSTNTPAYDTRIEEAPGRPPLRIDPALKTSYERFLVEHRDSSYWRLIDGIVTRLSRSGGVPNGELSDFLAAELTDPYFDHWLREARRWPRGRQ